MKLVVTGADGHIGRPVTAALVADGHHVVGIGLGERPQTTAAQEWVHADLSVEGIEPSVLEGAAAVVHLAAIPGRLAPDREVFRNNVSSTYNVLDSAGIAGVPRAVIASSISAYGLVWSDERLAPPELPLRETTPLLTTESYSLSKEVDETTARMMARRYGISVAALRFPLVQPEAEVRARAAEVSRDRTVGEREFWAYLTFEDAARAILAAVTAAFEGVLVANIVSPQALAGIDAVGAAAKLFPQVPVAAGASGSAYAVDVARDRLGFVASTIFL